MNRLLYLIGPPGAGKSTLMAETLKGVPVSKVYKLAVSYWSAAPMEALHGDIVANSASSYVTGYQISRQLPDAHGAFPGTDTLGMNEQGDVCKLLQQLAVQAEDEGKDCNVVGEGDRLANDSFFEWVVQDGYDLTVLYLDTPAAMLAARRDVRARQVGKAQDAKWVAGRETKCRRLANKWVKLSGWLNGAATSPQLVLKMREQPVIKAIRAGVDAQG